MAITVFLYYLGNHVWIKNALKADSLSDTGHNIGHSSVKLCCRSRFGPAVLSGQQDREPGQRSRGDGSSGSQRGVTGDRGGSGERGGRHRHDEPGGWSLPVQSRPALMLQIIILSCPFSRELVGLEQQTFNTIHNQESASVSARYCCSFDYAQLRTATAMMSQRAHGSS